MLTISQIISVILVSFIVGYVVKWLKETDEYAERSSREENNIDDELY